MLYYVVELQQKPSKNIIRPKKITGEEIAFKGLMLIDSKVTSDESQPRMRKKIFDAFNKIFLRFWVSIPLALPFYLETVGTKYHGEIII